METALKHSQVFSQPANIFDYQLPNKLGKLDEVTVQVERERESCHI